jgi:hypothetical protein
MLLAYVNSACSQIACRRSIRTRSACFSRLRSGSIESWSADASPIDGSRLSRRSTLKRALRVRLRNYEFHLGLRTRLVRLQQTGSLRAVRVLLQSLAVFLKQRCNLWLLYSLFAL